MKKLIVCGFVVFGINQASRANVCRQLFNGQKYLRLVDGDYKERLLKGPKSPRQIAEESSESIPVIAELVEGFTRSQQSQFWALVGQNENFFEALKDIEPFYALLIIEYYDKVDSYSEYEKEELYEGLNTATYYSKHPLGEQAERYKGEGKVVDLEMEKKIINYDKAYSNTNFIMGFSSRASELLMGSLLEAIEIFKSQGGLPVAKKTFLSEFVNRQNLGSNSKAHPEDALETWLELSHFVLLNEIMNIGLMENKDEFARPSGQVKPRLVHDDPHVGYLSLPEEAPLSTLELAAQIRRWPEGSLKNLIYDLTEKWAYREGFLTDLEFKQLKIALDEIIEKSEPVDVEFDAHFYDQLSEVIPFLEAWKPQEGEGEW